MKGRPHRPQARGASRSFDRGEGSGRASQNARVVWPAQERERPKEAIRNLMVKRGLSLRFEKSVEREARMARDQAPSSLAGAPRDAGRRDLRELPTFTIDPISARDFDDAISAEPIEGGGVRAWVHIADVSAYVPEGSSVDLEARRRGTSVYVPGAVEPMLPGALSGDACSLVPGAERLAVSVELELDESGVRRSAFYRSLIRSDERLDYERVDRIFAGREQAREPWGAPLGLARRAAGALERQRLLRASALTIDRPEPEFSFDSEGNVAEISMRVQTESHRLIEHLMIAANEAVARMLSERRIPSLYRVHERPQPAAAKRLADQLASLDVPTPAVPERMSSSQAADLVGELSRRVGAHVVREGGRLALSALVLRALQQAFYSPKNIGHAGLDSSCYCHFTSPIRRYPDLVCHRALLHAIGADVPAPRAGELGALAEQASAREREAMAIERDADDIARCFALERVLYEEGFEQVFCGEVTGLISAGAFIAFGGPEALAAPLFEGMLPVRLLRGEDGSKEWWELNAEGTILRGERSGASLRLGEATEVRVARVDAAGGRVDLLAGG